MTFDATMRERQGLPMVSRARFQLEDKETARLVQTLKKSSNKSQEKQALGSAQRTSCNTTEWRAEGKPSVPSL